MAQSIVIHERSRPEVFLTLCGGEEGSDFRFKHIRLSQSANNVIVFEQICQRDKHPLRATLLFP
jgi:hypothetical protein